MTDRWRKAPTKKYKPRDPHVTSAMMAAVKNRDSKAEILLRRELWRRGFRYRIHSRALIGKPDIVFAKYRTVIFVDGDFWHGRAVLEEGVGSLRLAIRSERSDWWISKISSTIERDKLVRKCLESEGWLVLRYWESQVQGSVAEVGEEVERILLDRRKVANPREA